LRDAALSNHFCVLFSICETQEICSWPIIASLATCLVSDTLCSEIQPKTHSAAAAPEPARVRLITAVVVTVVVLAGEFDELFLLKLAVVPDGTAALKVTVR
jgi:uncharacterized protein (DUF2336 family)